MSRQQIISSVQAAKLLGVSIRRVQQFIEAGRLPAEQVGGVYIIRRADLAKVRHRKPGRPRVKRK